MSKNDKGGKNTKRKFNKNSNPKGSPKEYGKKEGFTKTCEELSTADNDISWYSHNSVLLYDSANISYPYPVGTRLKRRFYTTNPDIIKDYNYQLLGIVKLMWRPSIGVSEDANSNVNVAANNLYSYIRQANSGAKNYDAPDLMLYLLAMDSVYAFHAWMMRLYGILCNTIATDRYMPEALVEACGGNYDDLLAHIADFRYYINFFGARLSAMAVPNTMYYFTRHRWMSSSVYCDEKSVKPQLYVFVPEGFWKFKLDVDSAGMLEFVSMDIGSNVSNPKTLTFDQIRTYGEDLLKPIIGSEDFNIMSGDILKAYQNIVQIPSIPEDYSVPFTYSSEVLEQIHNAKSYNVTWNADAWNVKQSARKDHLVFSPTGKTTSQYVSSELLLDSRFDMPTAQDTMIATRLSSMMQFYGADKGVKLSTAGSEVITGIYDVEFDCDTVDTRNLITRRIYTENFIPFTLNAQTGEVTVDSTVWNRILNGLGSGSADRYPLRDYIVPRITSGSGTYTEVDQVKSLGQKNNITVVPRDVLDRMHQAAILSLFGVPIMGNK